MGAYEWDGVPIDEELVIRNWELGNFPNPFNPETKISFFIPEDCKVELLIYNIKGQKVKQLVRDKLAGGHTQLSGMVKMITERGLQAECIFIS